MTASSLEPPIGDVVTVAVAVTGNAVCITVSGEVDSSSAAVLGDQLDAALGARPAELVVDLCDVGFLDSAGLSVLASAHRRATASNVRLRVLASNRAVMRPMQITGLWDLLAAEQVGPAVAVPSC